MLTLCLQSAETQTRIKWVDYCTLGLVYFCCGSLAQNILHIGILSQGEKQCRIANSWNKDGDEMLMQKKFKTEPSEKRRKNLNSSLKKMDRLTSVTNFIFWFSYISPLDMWEQMLILITEQRSASALIQGKNTCQYFERSVIKNSHEAYKLF